MSKQYQPQSFFRQSPNHFLKQYFAARDVLADVDFDALTASHIEPVYEAWLALPDDARSKMEQDFQEIVEIASEGGSKAILDEARFHGEDLAPQFAALKGFHEHAFWTFLEHPKFWRGAVSLNRADNVPGSYWRKRKNLPSKTADTKDATIHKLEQALGGYFYSTQGRGKNCLVDCYKRDERDYFFAYPEDYANANPEWEGKVFKRRPHHPAFEIIFVYSQPEGTLDIYIPGGRKVVPDLQAKFAEIILQAELGPDEKDERIYTLAPLQSRQFQFVFAPESGIADVSVKKLRFKVMGKKEQITLEADPTQNKYAVFDLLDKVTMGIPQGQVVINQISFKVTFAHNPLSRKANTRCFEIGWPNSCNLKHDGRDLIIQKMLADSNIEPKKPEPPQEVSPAV